MPNGTQNTRTFHINDINGLGDLQIDFKFEIKFSWDNPDATTWIGEKLAEDDIKDGSLTTANMILNPNATAAKASMFTAYARSVDFPGRENTELEDHYQGWKTIYPGKMSFGGNEVSISFAERQNGAIVRTIQAWQELINSTRPGSPRGSFQYTGDFKKDLTATLQVTMLRTDGSMGGMSGWYYKCWPKSRGALGLDMTSEDFVKPEITFAYDWSEIRAYTPRSGS